MRLGPKCDVTYEVAPERLENFGFFLILSKIYLSTFYGRMVLLNFFDFQLWRPTNFDRSDLFERGSIASSYILKYEVRALQF